MLKPFASPLLALYHPFAQPSPAHSIQGLDDELNLHTSSVIFSDTQLSTLSCSFRKRYARPFAGAVTRPNGKLALARHPNVQLAVF
jgi:hypothetical protein